MVLNFFDIFKTLISYINKKSITLERQEKNGGLDYRLKKTVEPIKHKDMKTPSSGCIRLLASDS